MAPHGEREQQRGATDHAGETAAYIGWRLLATDPSSVGFNVYRAAGDGRPRRLNTALLTTTTDFVDTTLDASVVNSYTVRAVVGREELEPGAPFVLPIGTPVQQFLAVPLQRPPGGAAPGPSGTVTPYTYNANDASAGDLDGDGEYEIVLKWDPTNARDT